MSIYTRLHAKLLNRKGVGALTALSITLETLELPDVAAAIRAYGRGPHDDLPEIHKLEVFVWMAADTRLAMRGI